MPKYTPESFEKEFDLFSRMKDLLNSLPSGNTNLKDEIETALTIITNGEELPETLTYNSLLNKINALKKI